MAATSDVAPATAPRSFRLPRSITHRWDHAALAFGIVFVVLIAVALMLPIWLPDPLQQNIADRLKSPSGSHWFGTDEFGRDLFARVIAGARVSLTVGSVAAVCALVVGGIYGAASGMLGKTADLVMMRVTEVILAFPGPLLALVLAVALGPGMKTLIIAIAIVYAAPVARLVRGLVQDERKQDYVSAAVLIGSSRLRIVSRHLLVNIFAPALTFTMIVAGDAILTESGLSYLGAGISPPQPSWGNMIQEGQSYTFGGYWWISLFPGLAIAIVVLCLNTLADMIIDRLRVGGTHRG